MENLHNNILSGLCKSGTKHFTDVDANIVLNISNFLKDLKQRLNSAIKTKSQDSFVSSLKVFLSTPSHATAQVCGISRASVFNLIKKSENKENPSPPTPERRHATKSHQFDSFCISHVRNVLYKMYEKKEYPTLKTLQLGCYEDPHFPRTGLSTFWRWLKNSCKFKFSRIGKKPTLLERSDVVVQRENYLFDIKYYRKNGYGIYCGDQTWTSPEQTRLKCWQTMLNNTEIQEFKQLWKHKVLQTVDGATGGFVLKKGNGRVVINHIGSESGFVQGAQDVFISKKDCKDYHSTMDATHFSAWFQKLVDLLPPKSVIVLDRASYHRKKIPGSGMPTTSWRKAIIIEWLQNHNVPLPNNVSRFEELTRPSLLKLSKNYPTESKYEIEAIAERSGKSIHVLWLPVAHCELNPIELIWAYVKGQVSKYNQGGLDSLYKLTLECLDNVTPQLWKECCEHVIKVEKQFWERDRLVDALSEPVPFIINVGNSSDSEEESSDYDDLSSMDEQDQ